MPAYSSRSDTVGGSEAMPSNLNPGAVIECVPNFSEGTDAGKVAKIVAAMKMDEVRLLDWSLDAAHNPSVETIAGPPAAVGDAPAREGGRAAALLDMTKQRRVHPRIVGAVEVPFVRDHGGDS